MKTKFFFLAVLLTGLFFVSCKKDNTSPLTITSISPDNGPFNTLVTIKGNYFSAAASGNVVKFNGVSATVSEATDTMLRVMVPEGAGTGPVTITTGGQTVTGPVFNYTYTITVSTLAGNGTAGFADGAGSNAMFNFPLGITTDAQDNVYVADKGNHRIRKVTPAGIVSTVAGNGTGGFLDGSAANAEFNNPVGVAVNAQGVIYVSDLSNCRIRKISGGTVSTFAGDGTSGFLDGTGVNAKFKTTYGIAVDAQGNLYVADAGNQRIRKITAAGVVSTLAGNGTTGFADGAGNTAMFTSPSGVALDANGNVYVADNENNRIRKITSSGTVSTLAGNGTFAFADGNGTSASFRYPGGVAVDTKGNVYVADQSNYRIRKITSGGTVSSLAGSGIHGYADGAGDLAEFYQPWDVAISSSGKIYVTDPPNNRIRVITVH